jgi:glutathione peroxidase
MRGVPDPDVVPQGERLMKYTFAVAVLLGLGAVLAQAAETKAPALNFKMKDIDGKEVDLTKYKGKVVMFVNVASKCGLTPQYKALQALHDKYADKGLVIIGVPANEFLAQEPGTNAEIKEFCTSKYQVKFPMLAKVVVKGKGACPLYEYLTTKTDKKFQGDIEWNFAKFVVSREGEVVARFKPAVKPDAKAVTEAIEKELKKK